ncbi:hypothetical protein J8TS2_03880 [Lederbergia ruris]|uniref:Transposase n=1 Tax=Lederbergia ruris TaxID=217495 RepID=A0ABQ4KF40_9BACI|nr:hypothetical protein J8TS2_03880 [Lederbergia ruris]
MVTVNKIPTSSFKMNELDLLIKLFAYNLLELFKNDHCLTSANNYTIDRFRREIIQSAGVLIHHAR